MKNKILIYSMQVIVAFVSYGVAMWIFNALFDNDFAVDAKLLIQSAIFALLFAAWTFYRTNHKPGE